MVKLLILVFILFIIYILLIMPNLKHKDYSFLLNRYFAHRGLHDNRNEAPENSLAAFKKAIDNNYGIELDVQLTKDDVLVIAHDLFLDRIFKNDKGEFVNGLIAEYTYEELTKYHILDSNEKIPTFNEVLKLVKGKVPLIIEYKTKEDDKELKACKYAQAVLNDYHGDYCIESFNPLVVLFYKNNYPSIIRGQLSTNYAKDEPSFKGLKYWTLTYLLYNFITKPDFIAYNYQFENNLSRRICKNVFNNLSIAYTIKDQDTLNKQKANFDILIFDSFIPDQSE